MLGDMDGLRHFIGVVLTLIVAAFVVVIAFKLLVGLVKLLVIGAAIGIGVVLCIYFLTKMRNLGRGREVGRYS